MVNGVSFRAKSLESAKDILNQPQTYSRPQTAQTTQADQYVKPKSHKTRNAVIGTLIGVAAVVGGLIWGHKAGGFNKIITAAGKDGAGTMTKWAGKLAGYAEQGGKALADWGTKGINMVKGWFNKPAANA